MQVDRLEFLVNGARDVDTIQLATGLRQSLWHMIHNRRDEIDLYEVREAPGGGYIVTPLPQKAETPYVIYYHGEGIREAYLMTREGIERLEVKREAVPGGYVVYAATPLGRVPLEVSVVAPPQIRGQVVEVDGVRIAVGAKPRGASLVHNIWVLRGETFINPQIPNRYMETKNTTPKNPEKQAFSLQAAVEAARAEAAQMAAMVDKSPARAEIRQIRVVGGEDMDASQLYVRLYLLQYDLAGDSWSVERTVYEHDSFHTYRKTEVINKEAQYKIRYARELWNEFVRQFSVNIVPIGRIMVKPHIREVEAVTARIRKVYEEAAKLLPNDIVREYFRNNVIEQLKIGRRIRVLPIIVSIEEARDIVGAAIHALIDEAEEIQKKLEEVENERRKKEYEKRLREIKALLAEFKEFLEKYLQ